MEKPRGLIKIKIVVTPESTGYRVAAVIPDQRENNSTDLSALITSAEPDLIMILVDNFL